MAEAAVTFEVLGHGSEPSPEPKSPTFQKPKHGAPTPVVPPARVICSHRVLRVNRSRTEIGPPAKNQRLAALCGNCRPDCHFSLDVCYAPSQDGGLPEPASQMARVCRNDGGRLRLRHPCVSAIMDGTEILGACRSFLRGAFNTWSDCSYESANRTFSGLRDVDRT